jgi:DNA (cytosine-5)-methyltransferase 1
MKKIRLFEMFAGFGGASFALKKAGIDFECVGYSEIDKFAVQCYEQNHNQVNCEYGKYGECYNWEDCIHKDYTDEDQFCSLADPFSNYGDCTKIDPHDIPDFDLLTAGFPCQSFSVAGKGLGEQDTRGTLFHDIIRIAEVKKPEWMLLENVKGLTTKRHKATFEKILSELDRIGYAVDFKVLNSKKHGIPQNRERIFFVCRLGFKHENFEWPEKEELKIFLKDILEDEVDEKYYLKEEQVKKLLPNQEVSYCIDANYYKGTNVEQFIKKRRRQLIQPFIAASRGRNPDNPSDRITGSPTIQRLEPKFDGTTNCISTVQKDNYVCIKNATKKGYQKARYGDSINFKQPNSKTRRGRVQSQIRSTLQTNDQRGVIMEDLRIRKLTPTECFRLQGFLDDGINLDGLSNTQKYKLAGNGWDINLVSKIFSKMFN